jgi:hypothetical protein
MTAIPKNKRLKSKKITDSAKGENCTLRIPGVCNFNPETTVPCHSGGAGWAYKSHDIHICYGCSDCHNFLDGGYVNSNLMDIEQLMCEFLRAMIETQSILIQKNLIKT